MDVSGGAPKTAFIAKGVSQNPPLPQRQIAVRTTLHCNPPNHQSAAEMSLDPAPSAGEISVAGRQGKDCVQMVRKDHDGIDRKGPLASDFSESVAQRADVIHEGCRTSIRQRHGKEIAATRSEIAPIPDHYRSYRGLCFGSLGFLFLPLVPPVVHQPDR